FSTLSNFDSYLGMLMLIFLRHPTKLFVIVATVVLLIFKQTLHIHQLIKQQWVVWKAILGV
ncbi:MAG: hypothetical protein ACOVOV_02825, partial [Dolichospermum sp.]